MHITKSKEPVWVVALGPLYPKQTTPGKNDKIKKEKEKEDLNPLFH
jgi:hypothetical protein